MAIILNTKEKYFTDYMKEAVDLIEREGLDNLSLNAVIQSQWVNHFKELSQLAHQVSFVDTTLLGLFNHIATGEKLYDGQTVENILQFYLGRDYSPDVSYKLYYNTVTQTFTTQPKPLETILLYEDHGFSFTNQATQQLGLGQAICQYMVDQTPKSYAMIKKEALARIRRRVNNAYKRQMIEDITSVSGKESLKRLTRGEILAIEIPPKDQLSGFLIDYILVYSELYLSESGQIDDLIHDRIQEVAQWTNGNFYTVMSIAAYLSQQRTSQHQPFPGELVTRLTESFIEIWDAEDVIEELFYNYHPAIGRHFYPFFNAGQGVPYMVAGLSDEVYERVLKQTIQCVTNRSVDFNILKEVTRQEWLDILSVLLKDRRSDELLQKWGGLLTSRCLCGGVMVRYNPTYQVADFLRPTRHMLDEDIRFYRITPNKAQYKTYIDDGVYEEVTELYQQLQNLSFEDLPIDSQQDVWEEEYERLRPLSELKEQIEGLPLTVDHFQNARFVYVPAISTDGLVPISYHM